MIYIIDDDIVMAKCIKRASGEDAKIFSNAIEAMSAVADALFHFAGQGLLVAVDEVEGHRGAGSQH